MGRRRGGEREKEGKRGRERRDAGEVKTEGCSSVLALTLLLLSILLQLSSLTFLFHKYLLYIIYEIASFSHLTGCCVLRLHWGNLENGSFDHNFGRER